MESKAALSEEHTPLMENVEANPISSTASTEEAAPPAIHVSELQMKPVKFPRKSNKAAHQASKDSKMTSQNGLLIRRSQCQSRDDSEIGDATMVDGDIVIKIHSKIIKARSLLLEINILLANSTTDIILKHKPVFDEEKRRLIKYQSSIDKIYQEGLTVQFIQQLTPIDCALCEATDFADWNALAKDINRLTRRLKDVVHLNNMVESTMSIGSSGSSSAGGRTSYTGSSSGAGGGIDNFFTERYDSNGVAIGRYYFETPLGSLRLTSMQMKMVGLVTLFVAAVGSMILFWPSSGNNAHLRGDNS